MKALPIHRHARKTRSAMIAALALILSAPAGARPGPVAHASPGTNYAPGPIATEVKVERVKPKREKYETLRFLKENRDFLRSRLDLLREKPDDRQGGAEAVDPRFLAYQQMLASILSARDSVAACDDARKRDALFKSVTDLGRLEDQLDQMERVLAEQRSRLGVLQQDFAGRQQTALAVVLSGYPGGGAVSSVVLKLEDGSTLSIPLSDEQRESLQHGGILQIFHGLVEPREQVIEVTLGGERWPSGNPGFIILDPSRDRLTFLRLDLSPARPADGASSMLASTWLLDSGLQKGDGAESEP